MLAESWQAAAVSPVRDTDTYSRVALAAELYDESPYMPARLGRFAGQLLLEVTVPF